MNKLFPQGLKPSFMWLETARLKPRPFKKLFMKHALVILCLCLPALGQATYSGKAASSGSVTYGFVQEILAGENVYCAPGSSGELTEGSPMWGASDGLAALSSQCMNTAMSSTPSGTHIGGGSADTFVPASGTTLANVLASTSGSLINLDGTTSGSPSHYLQCGDTIQLTAGSTYVAPSGGFVFPMVLVGGTTPCDGGHWIMVKTSEAGNANFPAEGVRATPCIAGIWNDATHGYYAPGYPPYPCPSYPTVLSAQLAMVTVNAPAVQFDSGASHYRFIGIEVTKDPAHRIGALIVMSPDSVTQGANHVIFDRSSIHGQPWLITSVDDSETQGGIKAKNSQWVAEINGWNYDTYCNSSCVDSQAFDAGAGSYQDGPFKLYNNLLASAAETIMFGGGGLGPDTPNTNGLEFRSNVSMKPLSWMVPIESCYLYSVPDTKNLMEMKIGMFELIEGNYFSGSWYGCQSDQRGEAITIDPRNQSSSSTQLVSFNGTDMVVTNTEGPFFKNYPTSGRQGWPDGYDASLGGFNPTSCPPGGCHLVVGSTKYIFCAYDGSNGCDQSGTTLHACTTTNCTARLIAVSPIPPLQTVSATWYVPGLDPSAADNNIVIRYNKFYNTATGISLLTAVSVGGDEAQSLDHASIHDNEILGMSTEMTNSFAANNWAVGFSIGNGEPTYVVNNIGIFHNTVAIEQNDAAFGGFGVQVDHQDNRYLWGLTIHDNVSPGGWHVNRGVGSQMSGGLANNFQTDACQPYYPNANSCGTGSQPCTDGSGTVINAGATGITFGTNGVPSGASYFADFIVTQNGKIPTSLSCTAGSTANDCSGTSFVLNHSVAVGDAFTIRDVTNCNWTFKGNIIGEWDPGQGAEEDPYPNGTDPYSGASTPNADNSSHCGVSGSHACILDQSTWPTIFTAWEPRSGDLSIASSSYKGTATDASSRGATGKDPGVDFTTLNTLLAGVHAAEIYPSLSITSGTLTAAIHNVAYQNALATPAYGYTSGVGNVGGGASPYKSWWQETDTSHCSGNCQKTPTELAQAGIIIGRDGKVNGPFPILLVSRTSAVSTFTPKPQFVSEMFPTPVIPWQVGQKVCVSGFVPTGADTDHGLHDDTFNTSSDCVASPAYCTISSVTANNFSCSQSGTGYDDIASHGPYHAQTSGAIQYGVVTFAPITPGTYQFWMGVKDGAFQKAWAQITVTVN